MERLGWHTALIVFDLKLVVSNMQPGCQGGGSLAVSRPFSCLLPADKESPIKSTMKTDVHGHWYGRVCQAASHKVLMELKSIKWDTPPKFPPRLSGTTDNEWLTAAIRSLCLFVISFLGLTNWVKLWPGPQTNKGPQTTVCWFGHCFVVIWLLAFLLFR